MVAGLSQHTARELLALCAQLGESVFDALIKRKEISKLIEDQKSPTKDDPNERQPLYKGQSKLQRFYSIDIRKEGRGHTISTLSRSRLSSC